MKEDAIGMRGHTRNNNGQLRDNTTGTSVFAATCKLETSSNKMASRR